MSKTKRLNLPMIMAAQAQKHITHNEALAELDILTQLTVESRRLDRPPAEALDGTAYLVPDKAEANWAGKDGAIAALIAGDWRYFEPLEGWRAFIVDEAKLVIRTGGDWHELVEAKPSSVSSVNVPQLSLGDLPHARPDLAGALVLLTKSEEAPAMVFCDGTTWRQVSDQLVSEPSSQ